MNGREKQRHSDSYNDNLATNNNNVRLYLRLAQHVAWGQGQASSHGELWQVILFF